MEQLVAGVDNVKFDIETFLEEQYGSIPLPFAGMDKSISGVCTYFPRGRCKHDTLCPYRHIKGDRTIVCKHWLRGLCKKGDQCEFLHEYDMTKMPECYFYSRFNACHNKECPFLHIDPESKLKDCPWYDRGFCRHGPLCRHRHVRRVLCFNYLSGFCPDGPACKFMHPRFELPVASDVQQSQGAGKHRGTLICSLCNEHGHRGMYCNKSTPEMRAEAARQENEPFFKKFTMQTKIGKMYMQQILQQGGTPPGGTPGGTPAAAPSTEPSETPAHTDYRESRMFRGPPKPLNEVTCFKCGSKGHYANRCPKGHLAFLSKAQLTDRDLEMDNSRRSRAYGTGNGDQNIDK